jgi:hypothetical protein
MSGYGTIAGSGGFVNYGSFNQNNGDLTIFNTGANKNYGQINLAGSGKWLKLGTGATLTNQGNINLNGESIIGTGTLNNSYGVIISGQGVIGSNFINSAGTLLVDSITTLSKAFTNSGTISLPNSISHLTGNTITSSGTMTLTGGPVTVYGNVVNKSAGKIHVDRSPAVMLGNITNNGTFKVTDTTVSFAGSFTNTGAYVSDPAQNYFEENLIVSSTGFITGGTGDEFYLYQNFINNSTHNTQWNTDKAYRRRARLFPCRH